MLHALSIFTQREPHTLPLSPALPDLKSDTTSYIHLQNLYKAQANAEKAEFVKILEEVRAKAGVPQPIPTVLVDEFVKNCHQLKIIKGKQIGKEDNATLRESSLLFILFCRQLTMSFLPLCSGGHHDQPITSCDTSGVQQSFFLPGIEQAMAHPWF